MTDPIEPIDIVVKNINHLFRGSGLSQEEFGEKVGLKQSAVSRLLKGEFDNPQFETLVSIAKAFNKSPDWLLTDHSRPVMSIHDAKTHQDRAWALYTNLLDGLPEGLVARIAKAKFSYLDEVVITTLVDRVEKREAKSEAEKKTRA